MQIKNPMPNLDSSVNPIMNNMLFNQIRMNKNETVSAFYKYRKNTYTHYPGSAIYSWWKK